MNAHSKSPEHMQAQIAAFTAEQIPYPDEQHIFANVVGIALGEVDEAELSFTHEYGDNPHNSERSTVTLGQYESFLRNPESRDSINGRRKRLERYADFASAVHTLKTELVDEENHPQHPGYLGRGSRSLAFSIIQGGETYVVRMPGSDTLPPEHAPKEFDNHLAAAILTDKGSPLLKRVLEDVVAASYIDGVTISRLKPGKPFDQLTPHEIHTIHEHFLSELVEAVLEANRLGVTVDAKLSNILYHPSEGCSLLDLQALSVTGNYHQPLRLLLPQLAASFQRLGEQKIFEHEKTAEHYAQELEFKQASLGLITRYHSLVSDKLTEEDPQPILGRIKHLLGEEWSATDYLSNPAWVARQVAHNQERQRVWQSRGLTSQDRANGSHI